MATHDLISQAPETSRWVASVTAVRAARETIADRARGTLLGLAVGNLLGLPVEGDRHDWIASEFPDRLTEIDPREASRSMGDDLAQAVDLGEALLHFGDVYNTIRVAHSCDPLELSPSSLPIEPMHALTISD